MKLINKILWRFGFVILKKEYIQSLENQANSCYKYEKNIPIYNDLDIRNKGYFNGLGDAFSKIAITIKNEIES